VRFDNRVGTGIAHSPYREVPEALMNIALFLKAGFMGFALSLGVLMLVFFLVGRFVHLSQRHFIRTFVLAALASFVVMDVFLYYRIRVVGTPDAQLFLAGCVGGWLSGILSGLTHMKRFLLPPSK
jgi:hypothetical protein